MTSLDALQRGDKVKFPLPSGEQVTGLVNLVQPDKDGWIRVGGELMGSRRGSFSLNSNDGSVVGTVLLPDQELAYEISASRHQQLALQEKPLSKVICFPIPRPTNEVVGAMARLAAQEAPPLLSSRPTTTAVLYLDFDGETVTDPVWNSGNTIVAQAPSVSAAQITEIWNRVKEDFWPFNIDVTTDLNRYNNAPVGRRMRCIITPTDTAAPGSGGIL